MASTVLPFYLVPVNTWKKEVVGKGNAKKEEVSTWLSEQYQAYSAQCENDQNLVDATCVALYGAAILTR